MTKRKAPPPPAPKRPKPVPTPQPEALKGYDGSLRSRPARTHAPARGRGATEVQLTRQAEVQQAVFRGMLLFIQNPGLTLRKVWEGGRLNDEEDAPYLQDMVTWKVFEKYGMRGGWRAKRDEHWAEIEKRVLAEAQADTVKVMVDEMAILTTVAENVMANITGITDGSGKILTPQAKPKSMEGLVNALVNLDKWRQAKRDRVMEHMAAAAGEEASEGGVIEVIEVPHVEDNLNDDEVEALAVLMAKQRAGLLTDRAGDEDTEDAEEA